MNTLRWHDLPQTRRVLTVAALSMAMAGTLLLCLGTGDFTLAVLVACAVALSFYLTEWTGLLRIGSAVANAAAVVAVVLVGLDFLQGGREDQLIAIANLLVYLQIILLFQEKTIRVYWHVILLALLQVVVGAALSLSGSFGLLLLGFIAIAVFTLHAFFLSNVLGQLDRHASTSARSAVAQSPMASSARRGADASSAGRRWSYAGRPMALSAVPAVADDRPVGVVRRLGGTTLLTLLFSLPVAALVFFAVPRMGRDPWRGGSAEQRRVVGFSQEVRLGELGTASENPEVVMRVRFVDPRTGRSFQLTNTPMLRGAVVTKYEGGKWTHHGKRFETSKEDLEAPPRSRQTVLQEISLEPLNEPVVFSVYPPYARTEQPVVYDVDREQLVRQPEMLQRSRLNLQIETTGIQNRKQLEILPAAGRLRRSSEYFFRLTSHPSFQDRPRSLNTVAGVAEQALRDAGAIDGDAYTICRALERYLQQGPEYTYTLTTPPRTPGLDPIEDFIVNNRSGNCEYFASALAIMLRSRGIPARVVIGYQGGEWNAVGQFYQFRQLHAHSWVEAYLRPEEVRPHVSEPDLFRHGGWLRLDPTAVTLAATHTGQRGVLSSMRQASDYVELVWIKYIVGMTSRRQQETLYRPLIEAFRRLIDPATFVESLRVTLGTWYARVRDWLRGNWFSWRGGLLAMAACLGGLALYRSGRWVRGAVSRLCRGRRVGGRAQGPIVPFYDHFERTFAAMGIARAEGQTQREFAMSVAGHLAESPATRTYTSLPRRIADAFYSVRFGKRPISDAVEQELLREVNELKTALRQRA